MIIYSVEVLVEVRNLELIPLSLAFASDKEYFSTIPVWL